MADARLAVEIVGKDSASSVFKNIANSAKAMGASVKDGATGAVAGLKSYEQQLKATEESAKLADNAGKNLGIGVAALGASFALYSREINTNQQNIATLGRTYGDASTQIQAFAQQIQQSTAFSSEAAIASANTFGTLVRNYGLSVEQVQQLIQVSTDLAATSGLSLEDVSQRVQAAIRGEGESAEALGLTMNQQAIDRNNLTLTMSNQEAAQFRLNALMEQSAFAQGAAADQAETAAGKTAQLANQVNDAARSFIEMTGPIGSVVGGLGSFGVQAGLAASGIVKIVQGAGQAASAVGGLSTVIGTAGFIAAAAGAYYGAQALARHFDSDFPAALHEAEGATKTLDEAISRMTITLGDAALALRFTKADTGLDQVMTDLERIAFLREQINTIPQGGRADDATIEQYKTELASLEATYGDVTTASQTASAAQDDFAAILNHASAGSALAQQRALELAESFNRHEITLADYAAQLQWITENYVLYDQAALEAQVATEKGSGTLTRGSEVAQSHAQAISDLTEQYGDLGLTVTDSISRFSELWFTVHEGEFASRRAASGFNEMGAAAEVAANSTGRMALSTRELMLATYDLWVQQRAQQQIFADLQVGVGAYTDDQKRLNASAHETAGTLKGDYANSLTTVTTLLKEGSGNFNAATDAIRAQDQALLAYTQQAFDAAKAVELLSTNAQLFQAAGIKTPALDVAVNLQMGQGGLDAAMGVIKTSQSMSSGIGAAKDWADALIDDVGVVSELDQLLADHRITQEQYKAAQEAQTSITRDVTNAQEDLNAVQAMQAPLVAEMVRQQAEYIDGLQNMEPQQQAAALGYMDTAESAKAMALAQLAASSTNATMQKSTTEMIQAAADADPVLKAMLEDMGLLNAEDGTVNFDTNAVDVGTAIEDLTESIDALIVAIGGVPPVHTDTNAKDTQGFVDDLHKSIDDIPDSVSTTINAIDNATGNIEAVREALRTLDNTHASTVIDNYVNTHQTTYISTQAGPGTGQTSAFNGNTILPEYATGGTVGDIPRYAGGGTYAMVGEYGPEMVWLNRGEQVTNAGATKSRMQASRQRGDGSINIYGPLTLQPAGNDAYDALQQAMRSGSRR